MTRSIIIVFLFFIVGFMGVSLIGNSQSKVARRYEIDAKRAGIELNSREALPRGREFKRIDSSYYVGWLLEGSYRFHHAADFLGYRTAAHQLDKALNLLEKDFKRELRIRTQDVATYLNIMKYHRDWDIGVYMLVQCYSNLDEPANVWKWLQRSRNINMQDELYCDTYNLMAWTIHRNRFYTQKQYSFLKQSIDENEIYALQWIDSAARKIKQDAQLNRVFFGEAFENEKWPAVWHYQSILYTYLFNFKEGERSYNKLRNTSYFPDNNYATFCLIQGKFDEAAKHYQLARLEPSQDKRLNESIYYLSILSQYGNQNQESIRELESIVQTQGSTPGFGWYNLALARNYLYSGQLEQTNKYIERADQFREIHIGTTLGKNHYDFTRSLLRLISQGRAIRLYTFLHKNWWYHPKHLLEYAKLNLERLTYQFLLINQFAANPERDRVIYKLFSTESTVSFDEIAGLLDGFSPSYFEKKFRNAYRLDGRIHIRPYFAWQVASALAKQKKWEEALNWLQEVSKKSAVNVEYNNLFQARCSELKARCFQAKNQLNEMQHEIMQCWKLYPQLLPYSDLPLEIYLKPDKSHRKFPEWLHPILSSKLNLSKSPSINIPEVQLILSEKKTNMTVDIMVILNKEVVIPPGRIHLKPTDMHSDKIVSGIFGIGLQSVVHQKEKKLLSQVK